LREGFSRARRHLDHRDAGLAETIELPSNGMELAVGRDERRPDVEWQGGEQTRDRLVRVLGERDISVRIVEEPAKAGLYARRLLCCAFPFFVDELRRFEPRALLRLERHVRPGLMPMPVQQQALADAEPRIMASQIER